MSFIDRLKTLMKRTGMNASGLANKLGVSRQSVAYWLAGRNNPSDQAIDKIAALFGVSAVYREGENPKLVMRQYRPPKPLAMMTGIRPVGHAFA